MIEFPQSILSFTLVPSNAGNKNIDKIVTSSHQPTGFGDGRQRAYWLRSDGTR
jgi:hypothetical protein